VGESRRSAPRTRIRLGGWVEEAGCKLASVRLIEPSGIVAMEDHVENQVVLFRSDLQITLPLTVQFDRRRRGGRRYTPIPMTRASNPFRRKIRLLQLTLMTINVEL